MEPFALLAVPSLGQTRFIMQPVKTRRAFGPVAFGPINWLQRGEARCTARGVLQYQRIIKSLCTAAGLHSLRLPNGGAYYLVIWWCCDSDSTLGLQPAGGALWEKGGRLRMKQEVGYGYMCSCFQDEPHGNSALVT